MSLKTWSRWPAACVAIAVSSGLVPGAAWAQADADADADAYEDKPPRLLAELSRVTLGASPRVDGDTVLGLSLGASLTQGVPPFGDGEAFGLAGLEENVFSHGLGSLHLRTALGVGFGSSRIYGVSEQTLDGGLRIPFGRLPLGLYARVGIDAGAYGDSRLYTSRITLPYGRVGLQWMGASTLVEVGAAGGAVLLGQFNVGDDGVRRLDGTSEIGPTLLVTTRALVFSGELRRIGADYETFGEAVLLARGMACGTLRGFGVALCMQASYGSGNVLRTSDVTRVDATSFFGGMTVGYLAE